MGSRDQQRQRSRHRMPHRKRNCSSSRKMHQRRQYCKLNVRGGTDKDIAHRGIVAVAAKRRLIPQPTSRPRPPAASAAIVRCRTSSGFCRTSANAEVPDTPVEHSAGSDGPHRMRRRHMMSRVGRPQFARLHHERKQARREDQQKERITEQDAKTSDHPSRIIERPFLSRFAPANRCGFRCCLWYPWIADRNVKHSCRLPVFWLRDPSCRQHSLDGALCAVIRETKCRLLPVAEHRPILELIVPLIVYSGSGSRTRDRIRNRGAGNFGSVISISAT